MSKLDERIQFLIENCEYVTIERLPASEKDDDGSEVFRPDCVIRLAIGGDEWEGVLPEVVEPTLASAVRRAVREVERHDRGRAKRARALR